MKQKISVTLSHETVLRIIALRRLGFKSRSEAVECAVKKLLKDLNNNC